MFAIFVCAEDVDDLNTYGLVVDTKENAKRYLGYYIPAKSNSPFFASREEAETAKYQSLVDGKLPQVLRALYKQLHAGRVVFSSNITKNVFEN